MKKTITKPFQSGLKKYRIETFQSLDPQGEKTKRGSDRGLDKALGPGDNDMFVYFGIHGYDFNCFFSSKYVHTAHRNTTPDPKNSKANCSEIWFEELLHMLSTHMYIYNYIYIYIYICILYTYIYLYTISIYIYMNHNNYPFDSHPSHKCGKFIWE